MAGKVKYSKSQFDAITNRGKNLLVSAAAGSGKTMVMVDRIIGLITSGEADVDDMLIVTFTNLAATKMKLEITEAIKKATSENSNKRDRLYAQLDKLYRDYISTFDKFSGRVIKEFFYKLDVSPDYSVCDEIKKELLVRDAMAVLFDELFADDSALPGCSFRDFLMHYSEERSEEGLKREMISTYETLRSMPNYFEWAETKALQLKLPEGGYKKSPLYKKYVEKFEENIIDAGKLAEEFIAEIDREIFPNTYLKFEPEYRAITGLARTIREEEITKETADEIISIKFPNFVGGTGEAKAFKEISTAIKPLREEYKDLIKESISMMNWLDEAQYIEMDSTYKYVKYYIDMLKRFEEFYLEGKQRENLMDFADINHLAFKILCDEEVSGILRDRFKYIFIDEYQDTNNLQEEIISRIARKNNLFKVGDIKQSIYSFRHAEPQIFLDTVDRYEKEEASENINLNENYRCNHGTVNFVNRVFHGLMDGYDEKSELHAGLPSCGEYDFKPDVHFIYTEDAPEEDNGSKSVVTKQEKEAEYVAELISNLIGTTFYDSSIKDEKKRIRKVEPKDIVVLMKSVKKMGGLLYRKLLDRGILSFVNNDDGYFDTVEIEVMLALINVIDNSQQDVPLISVLHSEIFGFTPEELATIRAEYTKAGEENRYKSFREAFLWYKTSHEDELAAKISHVIYKISEWRGQIGLMPLEDYIWYLMIESKYYIFAGAMRGGDQRQANLRILVDKALNYRLNGISSLSGFIRYLNILKKRGISTGEAITVGEKDNLVRIMTIHKSKGLEFPFVIVAGLESDLRYTTLSNKMILDGRIGLALPYIDRDAGYKRNTLMQRYIIEQINLKEFEEQKRVLYVALTRARQKLILTSTIKDEEAVDELLNEPIENTRKKYIKMLAHALDGECCNIIRAYPEQKTRKSDYLSVKKYFEDREERKKSELEIADEKLLKRLDYTYEGDTDVKAKYTVSELNSEDEQGEESGTYIRYPSEIKGSKVTAAEIGTGYHRLMEYLNFGECIDGSGDVDRAYIDGCFKALIKSKAISSGAAEAMDIQKVISFFASDIGRRASRASKGGNLLKEKAFTLRLNRKGKDILVQGVIDCLIKGKDEVILVDYKSNKLEDNTAEEKTRMREKYKTQIEIYRKAVEKGLGIDKVESYLYMFDIGELISMT